jgi:hypothetical protein
MIVAPVGSVIPGIVEFDAKKRSIVSFKKDSPQGVRRSVGSRKSAPKNLKNPPFPPPSIMYPPAPVVGSIFYISCPYPSTLTNGPFVNRYLITGV